MQAEPILQTAAPPPQSIRSGRQAPCPPKGGAKRCRACLHGIVDASFAAASELIHGMFSEIFGVEKMQNHSVLPIAAAFGIVFLLDIIGMISMFGH